MKSPMIENLYAEEPEEITRYTELQVLRSGAGFYVGTMYNHSDGYQEPGSRDSFDYYRTPEEAATALVLIEKGELRSRMEP